MEKKPTEDFLSHCKKCIITINIKMGKKQNNQRYLFVFSLFRNFKAEGLGDASNWEKAIKNYMCNSCCEKLGLIYTINRYCPVQSSNYLTLQQQF